MFLFMFQKLVLNMVETANDEEAELVKKHHSEIPDLGLGVDPQEYRYIILHSNCIVVLIYLNYYIIHRPYIIL